MGGICLFLSTLFLSLTPLFVIFPPPTNPTREPMLLKTYIAEVYAAILSPGRLCQQHIE